MSRDVRSIPKVTNLQPLGWLFLAAQMVLAVNGADQPFNEKQPDPRNALETIAQARQKIASGEIEFDMFTYFSDRPLNGTNHVRLKVVFDGEKRRCEQFGREYSYVLIGPNAGAVTDAKRKELGLDKEAAVQAGLLTGFESHYVTAYDGVRVLTSWSASRNAMIDDPIKGSSSAVFDPRVLGLSSFLSVTDTIESCLAYGRAESVQLVGNESVEGVAAWHVRVSDSKSSANPDFWIDASHPGHVVKCEFNGSTVFSRFDAAHPEDPIPIEVRSVNSYGRERARMDRTIMRRSARYNVPIDGASWTIAGLNIPVGTPVIDRRMSPETLSRETWYWDGTGLSTNRPSNRAQPARERRSPPDPAKLLALAEKDSQSLFALEAATWIILNTSDGPEVEKAADIILREHLRSTNLVQLCEGLRRLPHRSAVPLLRSILRDNSDPSVQARARFELAILLKNQANATGGNQAAEEAARLFERIVDEYGEAANSEIRNLVDEAQSELSELRRFGVGKLAPNIEGEDLEGRKMKLSDYRGKVVVLSFWGTWCGPCMAMVPDERKLVERMAGKPFALIGVNSDDDETKWKRAVEKERIIWPSFRDGRQGAISKAWNVRSWPTVYVLDAKGIIRYRDVQGQALFGAVEKLIRETKL